MSQKDYNPRPPSSDLKRKYSNAFTGTGYDSSRSLWLGDLKPWMDENYFVDFFIHVSEDDAAVAVIRNEETKLPEYAFFQFKSTKAALRILCRFGGYTMPNSTKTFDLKWVTFVCGLPKPNGCHMYPGVPSIAALEFDRSLVSIEFVRVKNIKSAKHPIKLYGTVILGQSGLGRRDMVVYHRSEKNCQRVQPGDLLKLTGPLHFVTPEYEFSISAKLLALGDGDDPIAEGEISSDQISIGEFPQKRIAEGNMYPECVVDSEINWLPLSMKQFVGSDYKYDQRLQQDIDCGFGTVTVGYSVFEDALNATFEVSLDKKGGGKSRTVSVHGLIGAVQCIGESESYIKLLDTSDLEPVEVYYNHVPLTRSTVVIPGTGLKIEVSLWDGKKKLGEGDGFIIAEPGKQIIRIGQVRVDATVY